MIDDHNKNLIHAGLDGELDESGQAELQQLLDTSPQARDYHDQMLNLNAFLERVPDPELPEDLHGSIMNAISLPAARRRRLSFGFSQFPGFVRYGLATAAGLLLAIGMYEYSPRLDGMPDQSSMVGTIMPGQNQAPAVVLDSFAFDLEPLSSEIDLLRRDANLVLDVQLNSAAAVHVTVDFKGNGLAFDAIAQMDSDLQSIEVADHTVRITSIGRQHFAVLLHQDPGAPVDARLLVNWHIDGKVLKTKELAVN
jgi:hypothetical protein